jgi:hypothetical protein
MKDKAFRFGLTVVATIVSASLYAQSTVTVYSQNTAPGDLYSNPGPSVLGSSFGDAHWVYNNVRSNGQVGIRNNYPRSGNGSVYFNFNGTSSAAKADIAYFDSYTNSGGNYVPATPMGLLSNLTHFSYDWYRDSSSTALAYLHPSLRLQILRVNSDGTFNLGHLVFERVYNQGAGAVPTDQWVTDDIIGSNYKLWSTAPLGFGGPAAGAETISDWLTIAASVGATLYVVSVNAGIGSGWSGTFTGAVDNITFGFNGQYTTYNFEVVPEPASLLALGSGVVSLLALRRRRR